jgi:DNA-directed RNA polymerase subunit beta'
MMSTNNILHPANGQPIIVPSQDIVLGLYYLSLMREHEPGEGMMFGSLAEIHHALAAGVVTLHAKIKGRYQTVDDNGEPVTEIHDTTPGRLILGELLPRQPGVKFALVNQLLTKKNISGMIDAVYRNCGQKETVIFCDRIMQLGFHHAFKAGISFGKDDMLIPAISSSNIRTA